jgi:galactonate dehydratase
MRAVIEDVFARHMAGENPENIEMMFRRAYSAGFTQRPGPDRDGRLFGARDRLLGHPRQGPRPPRLRCWAGVMNDRIRAYTYLYPLPGPPAAGVLGLGRHGRRGGRRPGRARLHGGEIRPRRPLHDPRRAHAGDARHRRGPSRFAAAIREAVGDRADLLFGTHGQFTPAGAIRLGQAIEPFSPLWFEEPVPPDNPLDFAEVAAPCASRSPPASG